MGKNEYRNETASIPAAVFLGTVVSTAVTLIGAVVVAALISNAIISDNSIGYSVLLLALVSAFLGCSASILIARRRLLIVSICTAIVFLLVLLSVTAIFYGGQYSGIPATVLVILGGGISSVLLIGKIIYKTKTNSKRVKL